MHFRGKTQAFLWVNVLALLMAFQAMGQVNTVTTAVPFLRIPGDSRSMGMANIGVAISPDANGGQLNQAKMAFIDHDYGVGLSFTPWLQSLVGDMFIANLTGYYRIKKVQTVSLSVRYFSLGQIQYTDNSGNNTIAVHPNEFYIDAGYSRRFGQIVSIGATLRFVYSQIAPNAGTSAEPVQPGIAGCADLSVFVDKKFDKPTGDITHELLWGLVISNLGNKITYVSSTVKDFLPANLGIGFGYKMHFDSKDYNTLGIYAEFNKLLVPTPNQLDTPSNIGYHYSAYQQNESPITGVISSFYDAPRGALEELQSIDVQGGIEYFFKNTFGIRAGYFYENPNKGNRNFLTVGATIKYNIATLHASYLVPTTTQRNPLDNTFSFSLTFEFNKGGFKKKTDAAPTGDNPPAEESPGPKKNRLGRKQSQPAPAPAPDDNNPIKQ